MKNKKAAYILIPVVILIWGLIFYKFIKGFSETEPPAPALANLPAGDSALFLPDTFSLSPPYRDPFLDRLTYINTQVENKTFSSKPALPSPPIITSVIPWPAVSYGGVIKSMKRDKQIAIATIDGKEYLFKQGDIISGIQAVTVYKDSVKFKRNKEFRTFHK